MKRSFFAAIAAMACSFVLLMSAGCTLAEMADCPGASCQNLSVQPGTIKVPCDFLPVDGVTDCVAPTECRDAANTAECPCDDYVGTTCVAYDPTCVCAVPPVCGDGTTDPGEVCDDGNTTDGDGCSANCLSDESCPNGILDVVTGETCDDGNAVAGDGCSPTCQLEACGNGLPDPGEVCDDGNTTDGDGCSGDCLSDESCGNGIVDVAAGEVCDDGNIVAGDGCSADCLSDEVCGNGILDVAAGEVCDDGNIVAGDGCSDDCLSDESGNGTLDPGEDCDGGAGCDLSCACPADFLPDGLALPGCLACDVGGVCQDPTSNYCADVPVCWGSAVRIAAPAGLTFWLELGTGLQIPVVIPANGFVNVGFLPTDLGAEIWITSSAVSVDTVFPASYPAFPPLPGVWLPGPAWGDVPNTPSGPATFTNLSQFNVTSLTNAYFTVAP